MTDSGGGLTSLQITVATAVGGTGSGDDASPA